MQVAEPKRKQRPDSQPAATIEGALRAPFARLIGNGTTKTVKIGIIFKNIWPPPYTYLPNIENAEKVSGRGRGGSFVTLFLSEFVDCTVKENDTLQGVSSRNYN